jgi:hypothetical protein
MAREKDGWKTYGPCDHGDLKVLPGLMIMSAIDLQVGNDGLHFIKAMKKGVPSVNTQQHEQEREPTH